MAGNDSILTEDEKFYFLYFVIVVSALDGVVDRKEEETINKLAGQIGASTETISRVIETFIDADREKIEEVTNEALRYFAGKGDIELNKKLYKGMFMVASADGDFDEDEETVIDSIAVGLQISRDERQQIEKEVLDMGKKGGVFGFIKSLFGR